MVFKVSEFDIKGPRKFLSFGTLYHYVKILQTVLNTTQCTVLYTNVKNTTDYTEKILLCNFS